MTTFEIVQTAYYSIITLALLSMVPRLVKRERINNRIDRLEMDVWRLDTDNNSGASRLNRLERQTKKLVKKIKKQSNS
jgi:hypothetical protein